MNLNERKIEMFEQYVVNSLVEKFNYTTEGAKEKINDFNLVRALQKNSASILFFDAEYWAGQITLNN